MIYINVVVWKDRHCYRWCNRSSRHRDRVSFNSSSWGRINVWQRASSLFPEKPTWTCSDHTLGCFTQWRVQDSDRSIAHHRVIGSLTSITAWPVALDHCIGRTVCTAEWWYTAMGPEHEGHWSNRNSRSSWISVLHASRLNYGLRAIYSVWEIEVHR